MNYNPSKNEFLSYDELRNAIENDGGENNFKTAATFLLNAVSDFPTFNLKEPADLIINLRQELNDKLVFENIDNYLRAVSIENDIWTQESISSLLEMFDFERKNIYDKKIELDTIIRKLTEHYRL
jgi:hypothetical protein